MGMIIVAPNLGFSFVISIPGFRAAFYLWDAKFIQILISGNV
jgi:hypothetical protein